MKRLVDVFATLLLAPFLDSPVRTQVNSNLAGAITQLLDRPAPPPPPKELAEALALMGGPYIIYVSAGDPSDPGEDAPIEVLRASAESAADK
jgi:hypothetical protein